jgi:hypothetical protein
VVEAGLASDEVRGASGADAGPLSVSRRQFLVRTGVVGAGAYALLSPSLAWATDPLQLILDRIAGPALETLSRDTFAGLVAFQVPGPDKYSQAQGVTDTRPGGIAADAQDLLLKDVDYFLPVPDSYAHALAATFTTAVSDIPIPVPILRRFGALGERLTWHMDDALRTLLTNDATVPVSLPIALMLNFLATQVDPTSITGPFPSSPFANLSFAQKGAAFQLLEQGDSDLVAVLDSGAPEPFKGSASGLMKFVGGALLEFGAFLSYVEWQKLDVATRTLSGRPVGWNLSNYMPGMTTSADGWDEFKGYFQGRQSVT